MSNVKNVVLCGVGGQGTILASKILSYALIEAGYDVKMSEIHGMSQRGGSVTTQVRYGDKVYSAIIGKGSADVLVAFEKMEALRYLDDVKVEGGVVIINDHAIQSLPTLQGMASYPRTASTASRRRPRTSASSRPLRSPASSATRRPPTSSSSAPPSRLSALRTSTGTPRSPPASSPPSSR